MHLADCFTELLAFGADFRETVEAKQPPFEQVKGTVNQLLQDSASHAAERFPREDFDLAHFAVCAWLDEIFASSPWQHRQLWVRERLQRSYFNTTEAGEEFFERLQELEHDKRDVREVYYLCLALGFTGRFCLAGDENQLEQLKSANLKLLLANSDLLNPATNPLFPQAYPCGSPTVNRSGRRPFPLLAALSVLGLLLLFAILFLVYSFTLSTVAEHFLRAVN